MPAFISKQPNGLYCRFSTVVDTLTHIDMTEEEYIELCVEEAKEKARRTLERDLVPFEKMVELFLPNNHSVEEFNSMLKEMGSDIVLNEKDYQFMEEER